MNGSPKILLIFAAILAVLGGIALLLFQSDDGPDLSRISKESSSDQDSTSTTTSSTTEERASSGLIELNQDRKYFSRFELEAIGIEPTQEPIYYLEEIKIDLLSALLRPDGIPSIDEAIYEAAWEADEWLDDDDMVMTVLHEGIVRAYPTLIMNWHEIVNDKLGDLEVAITFCPLCNSGLIFVRPEINGVHTEFGTSGRIYQSDLVMYDRATGSFWSQIEGRPIMGPLAGKFEGRLEQIPAGLTQWGFWKEAYPDTEVLARPTTAQRVGNVPGEGDLASADLYPRNYTHNPYEAYLTDNGDTFRTPFGDRRLSAKADVVGIRLSDAIAKAYLKESVKQVGLINDELAGTSLLVLWDEISNDVLIFDRTLGDRVLEFRLSEVELVDTETNTMWNLAGEAISGPLADEDAQLSQLAGMTTFWFAWFNFHPHTELFAESSESQEAESP